MIRRGAEIEQMPRAWITGGRVMRKVWQWLRNQSGRNGVGARKLSQFQPDEPY